MINSHNNGLKLSKLFLCIFVMSVLSTMLATAHVELGEEEAEEVGHAEEKGAETDPCISEEFDESTYNSRLHVGALFIIFFTSSFGAFIPVISKKFKFNVSEHIFFFCKHFGTGVILATAFIHMIPTSFDMLTSSCLPKVWNDYPAWAGAIAMMAATVVFFIEYISIKVTEESDNKESLPSYKNDHGKEETDDSSMNQNHNGTLVLLAGKTQTIGIIILEAGICFHSVIIGMALSVSTGSDFISLLIALVFHQMFEGLGLGSRIAQLDCPKGSFKPWIMSSAYGLTTPIGIAIGLGIHGTYNPGSTTARIVQGVLDSVSAGILIYTALVELIANDFINDRNFRKRTVVHQSLAFVFFILGAGIMSLIGAWA